MLDILVYLLPISGTMLLKQLQQTDGVRVRAAFLAETFRAESQEQIQTLEERDIPYRIPGELESGEIKRWVNKWDFQLGISVGYDKKLPSWLINGPELGTVNIHPALLPRYRGANPYFWVIRNHEDKTGTTLHLMDEGFDTGPILSQREVSLDGNEAMGEVFFRLNELGCSMALDLIEEIQKSGMPSGKPQVTDGDFPDAPRINETHLRIDWSAPYEEIDALVRAGNPFFGAHTTFRGTKLKIFEVESVEDSQQASPGTIRTTEGGPLVRCKDGWVRLLTVRMGHYYVGSGKAFQQRESEALSVLNKLV